MFEIISSVTESRANSSKIVFLEVVSQQIFQALHIFTLKIVKSDIPHF